jgi:ribosomal protein S18 acetylase RimI-like enzyme
MLDQNVLELIALAQRSPETHLHMLDLPYRLSSWALDDPANLAVWRSNEQVTAWALLNTPFWTIDMAIQPGREQELLPKILFWADGRARLTANSEAGHECWFIVAFEDQPEIIRILQSHGYADQSDVGEDSWSKVWLKRPAAACEPIPLPEGFSLRQLKGLDEAAAYVDLHRAAFESKNMTEAWRQRTIRHPHYRPELDLVVESPNGQLAAFCIAWVGCLGAGNSLFGQIEPLGVGEAYRGLGLGKALLHAAVSRLQAMGAQAVYVETDRQRNPALNLYQSSEFALERNVLVFRKDFV